MYAVNNTRIPVYGTVTLELNLGLRHPFLWTFLIADIDRPILGIDFLSHFDLLISPFRRIVIDHETGLEVKCEVEYSPSSKLSAIPPTNDEFHSLLKQFPNLASPADLNYLPPVKTNVRHHIITTGPPVSCRPRRLSPENLKIAKEEFRILMQLGVMRPSSSPWASPLHMVPKNDGSWRVVGDYPILNVRTCPDSYPLPHIQDFALNLEECTIFSRIDLQILVAEDDIQKTAVSTPFGLFEFVRMPMGLCNGAQTFQRFMDDILRELPFAYAYLDDLLIASKSAEEHREHVAMVLERLQSHGITINIKKSVFGESKLKFVGHIVSADGIHPTPEKVEALSSYPLPATIRDLRRFTGMLNFYHRFIPHLAELQAPLTNIYRTSSKKNDCTSIQWTEELRSVFESCKSALSKSSCLTFPDSSSQLILNTDASSTAIIV